MMRCELAAPTVDAWTMRPHERGDRPGFRRASTASWSRAWMAPRWTHVPIAQAQLLSSGLEMPRYCESLRCQGKRRPATTFHALINVPGEPDRAWVACADCTGLMTEGAYAG
jgi:hypothetical protein